MTIKESYELFLQNGSTYWVESTKAYYEKNCGYFFQYLEKCHPEFEHIDIVELPRDILKDYIIWLRNKDRFSGHPLRNDMRVTGKVKANTVKTYMRAVKAYFNFLYDQGYLKYRYTYKLTLPRSDDDQIVPLLASEVAAIDNCFDRSVPNDLRNLCIFHLMLDAGLRSCEVCNLTPSDIIFHSCSIVVNQGKGNKSRIVIMGQVLYNLLSDYFEVFSPAGYLFCKSRSKEPINYSVLKSLFQRIVRNTDICRVHPHLLRHTFATSFLMGGGNLESLRILMGHVDYSVTRRYLHLATQNQIIKSDIYKLDPAFFNNGY